jgi:hypothetical protein
MPTHEKHRIVGSKHGVKAPAKSAGSETEPHEYWTPERRAAAIPVPLPKKAGTGKEHRATEKIQHVGKPGHTPPGPAKGAPEHKRENRRVEDNGFGGFPVPYPLPLEFPYSACGKLFLTQGDKDHYGSASVVGPNIILTAGHCVHKNGVWSTNVAFYPSYPLTGVHFSYSVEAAWTDWTDDGNHAFDYGMIWIDNDPGYKVGWLGLLWFADPSGRVWNAVGYPYDPNPPFDGNAMSETLGEPGFGGAFTGTIGLFNDNLGEGSSGGPWLTDFNGSPPWYANGLQSYRVDGEQEDERTLKRKGERLEPGSRGYNSAAPLKHVSSDAFV